MPNIGGRSTKSALGALLLLLAVSLISPAQTEQPEERQVEAVEIRALREQTAADATLEEELRKNILALYDAALSALDATANFEKQTRTYRRQAAEAGPAIEQLRKALASPPEEAQAKLPPGTTASQAESLLTEERARLQGDLTSLREIEDLTEERGNRRQEFSRRLGALDRQIEVLNDELRAVTQTESHPDLKRAARRSAMARIMSATAEQEMLRARLALFDAEVEKLPIERDLAERRVEEAEARVTLLEAESQSLRAKEAAASIEEVRALAKEITDEKPDLEQLAAQTVAFAEMLWGTDGIIAKSETVARELQNTRKNVADLDRITQLMRRRFEAVGRSGSVTQWWPKVPPDFPTLADLGIQIEERERLIPNVQHQLILLEQERSEVAGIEKVLRGEIRQAEAGASKAQMARWRRLLRRFADERRDLLDELVRQYGRYSNLLTELDQVSKNLLFESNKARSFLLETLLWVRSVPDPVYPSPGDAFATLGWLINSHPWDDLGRAVARARLGQARVVGYLILIVALLVLRRRNIRRLEVLAGRVRNETADRFRWSLEAVAHTFALAAPLPMVLFGLYRLCALADHSVILQAAGEAFYYTSGIALFLTTTRQLLRPNGFAEAHLGWPARLTRPIFNGIVVPMALFLPLIFVAIHLAAAGLDLDSPAELQAFNNSLGRVAFIVAMVVLSVGLGSQLRPRGEDKVRDQRGRLVSLSARVSMYAVPVVIVSLVIPAVLAAIGYYITAYLLAFQMLRTLWLALGLVFLGGLLFRWQSTSRRTAAIASAAEAKRYDTASGLAVSQADVEEAEMRTRSLFRFVIVLTAAVGLYTIWAAAIPTLNLLKRVQVWPTVQIIQAGRPGPVRATTTAATGAGGTAEQSQDQGEPAANPAAVITAGGSSGGESGEIGTSNVLTVWNLLQALLAGLLTLALVQNIPGLLELIMLRRTMLDAGARIAVSTLVRYAIMIFGVSATFSLLGLTWDKIQWLAAALTFGLGFGLQEIVANFVSGLILLLERPVRVGDAVTIGNLSGKVNSIRIRATTVTLWDRSEMIVPNKEFITTKLVNWTLSDSKTRVDIPVRVAYGTDVDLVMRVLKDVAAAHPRVLQDPKPNALLIEFAESALYFELRVFIDYGFGRVTTKHELQVAIDREFKKAGIRFAVPRLTIEAPGPETQSVKPIFDTL